MTTFQFLFSNDDIEMILPKYVHFNGQKLNSALEEFSITSQFLGSKKQNINFLQKRSVLSADFIKLKYMGLQTRLVDFEKTPNT